MSYPRVIPRDLFNEANLLKCLGQLYLKLEARPSDAPGEASVEEAMEMGCTEGFEIRQNPDDGSIHAAAVQIVVNGATIDHYRPLYSRAAWPLWVWADGEDIKVFTDEGELSPEFEALIGL